MGFCTACGHELGVGRFCTNCGFPIASPATAPPASRTDTAPRPAVPAIGPAPPAEPPVDEPDPESDPEPVTDAAYESLFADAAPKQPEPEPGVGPRYPLWADQATREAAPSRIVASASPPMPSPLLVGPHDLTSTDLVATGAEPGHRSERRLFAWLPWALLVVLVLAGLGFGVRLLLRSDDGTAADPTPVPTSTGPHHHRPSPSPTSPSPTTPTTSPTSTAPGGGTDIARFATATVPATAPPNQDVDGNLVRYDAFNMLDGVASTCWRMPGDGAGDTITFALAEPTTITSVGLINGYAKTAHAGATKLNWYTGNRRILDVRWTFDDGTTVDQQLRSTRSLQSVDVPSVQTSSVRLTLVDVTAPGRGPAARDNTAISDVSLVGTPG